MALSRLFEDGFQAGNYLNNPRIWGVLQELQRRQNTLLELKGQELMWKIILCGACIASVFTVLIRTQIMVGIGGVPLAAYLILLIADLGVFYKLRRIQVSVQKALVNFGVVRHHILGMVEVGLCTCSTECECKDRFRQLALSDFGVNLY